MAPKVEEAFTRVRPKNTVLVDGWWGPTFDEANLSRLIHHNTRNTSDILLSANMAKGRDLVVQAGGHIGIWPLYLAKLFKRVITCEPQPDTFEAMRMNLARVDSFPPKIDARRCAMWHRTTQLFMERGEDSGRWRVTDKLGQCANSDGDLCEQYRGHGMRCQACPNKEKDGGRVWGFALDDAHLEACDAIYLDIEGAEANALAGAEQTIRRFKPVLHLEILPPYREATEKAIEHLGYRFVESVHKDSIFVPA